MLSLLGVLGVITSLFACVMPAYFARKTAGYSSRLNTLSELGATGSRYQKAVSRFYFLPLGVMTIVFVILAHSVVTLLPQSPFIWGLIGLVGVGYLVAAIFPCDQGAPIGGSVSNQIHNIAGLFEYLGAGVGLILLGREAVDHSAKPLMSLYLILSGSVILLSLVLLILPRLKAVRGVVQRAAETSFFAWMLTVSLLMIFGAG
ncbi:DUF998 domain-containing protein [Alkalimarinus sediminis]|uniref:DUF998 domain-containing protein n=1 Tax=Alkalimarinus sediminis TaxID=1632866 RepID=A0A9E8HHU2_9ALTE|nr:DUF998 domain-containing protein [Alkalimarinus sediminis]UZW74462.1 DUF998 domain-containing protein [Alkalimarinus sediminis]